MFRKKSKAEQAKDAVQDVASDRAQQVNEQVSVLATQAKDAAVTAKDAAVVAKDRAVEAANEWAPVARERASEAAHVAAERGAELRAKAAEATADARARAAEATADARANTAEARGKAAASAGAMALAFAGAVREALANRGGGKVGEKAAEVRDRAVAGLDHRIDAAVPRGQEAVEGLAPKVDHARDVIVDDVLPKLQELLGNVQSAKDELLAKQDGPVAAVTGAPKKQKRKGGVLLALGALAAAGAGIAWYLNKQQNTPADDPWAERPIGGAGGVDTQVRETLAAKGDGASAAEAAADADAVAAGAPAQSAASSGDDDAPTYRRMAAASGVGGAAAAAEAGSDEPDGADERPLGTLQPADSATTEAAPAADDDGGVHVLASEEIDALAATDPQSAPIDPDVTPSGADAAAHEDTLAEIAHEVTGEEPKQG